MTNYYEPLAPKANFDEWKWKWKSKWKWKWKMWKCVGVAGWAERGAELVLANWHPNAADNCQISKAGTQERIEERERGSVAKDERPNTKEIKPEEKKLHFTYEHWTTNDGGRRTEEGQNSSTSQGRDAPFLFKLQACWGRAERARAAREVAKCTFLEFNYTAPLVLLDSLSADC